MKRAMQLSFRKIAASLSISETSAFMYAGAPLHRLVCTSLYMCYVYHAQCRSRDPATAVQLDQRFPYQQDGDLSQ